VVLNYHRIGDGRRSVFDRCRWSATEEDFDRQVKFLTRHFDVISPRDIPYVVRVRRGRHVMITFDDGYADNYNAAFPILRSHGAVATFFVATGYIDEPRLPWWDEIAWMVRSSRRSVLELPAYLPAPVTVDEPDRERAVRALLRTYKGLPSERTAAFLDAAAEATGSGRAPGDLLDVRSLWMSWGMLREMHAAQRTVGGHTVNHPLLSRMTREEQAAEIRGCARRLHDELGIPMLAFAYPVGTRDAFNADTRACLEEAGVASAFSYYGGIRRLDDWDALDVPRIAIEQEHTFADFRAAVMFPWAT